MGLINKRIEYTELSKAKIQDKRNLVISKASKGGFTIAQQLEISEEGRRTQVFLKGATIVDDIDGLINLRDALNVAIKLSTSSEELEDKEENEDWDS